MKKVIAFSLCFLTCILCCGCNKANLSEYSSFDMVSHSNESDSPTSEEVLSYNPESSKIESMPSQNTSLVGINSSNNSTSKNDIDNKNDTTTSKTPTKKLSSDLPQIFCSKNDSNLYYRDIVALKNGGFAVVGNIDGYCFIRTYNSQLNIVTANYKCCTAAGYDSKIADCGDGGILLALGSNNYLVKLDGNLKEEWIMNYEPIECGSNVHDVEQISSNCYAVLFDSIYAGPRTLKIAFVDSNGTLIEIKEIMAKADATDADIIADNNGGFYLTATCDEKVANKYAIVKSSYNSAKRSQAAVMHFNNKYELDWATTFGGNGDDWCEEGNVDDKGNLYVAVCTNSFEKDEFWTMEIDNFEPYRRALVKLDSKGKLVYTHNLSNKGGPPPMNYNGSYAIDKVYNISINDDMVYVVGMSKYFDGIQEVYECKQISSDSDVDTTCIYTVAIDKNGKEISRDIFKYNNAEGTYGATVLNNGTVVICGSVLASDNAFNIDFEASETRCAALFAYE